MRRTVRPGETKTVEVQATSPLPGVKPEELEWLGLEDWPKEQKGPVTKDQIADYVRANRIEVREVEKGDTPNARALVEFQGRAIDQYGGLTAFWEKAPPSEVAEWERLTPPLTQKGRLDMAKPNSALTPSPAERTTGNCC